MLSNLRNSHLDFSVRHHGAELCSIKGRDSTMYIWQADPKIWGRHSPILFPIVGRLLDDQYTFNNKTFYLPQHGFARDSDFTLVDKTSDTLFFELVSSKTTKDCYPFDFILAVNYRLNGNAIEIEYTVKNNGTDLMPFSLGAHPAFALSWNARDVVADYFLEFEKSENLNAHLLSENGLLSKSTVPILESDRMLFLCNDLFDNDALILLDLESTKISLGSKLHKKRVTVDYSGFKTIGIWAKPGAPFVCIEPWHGHADPVDSDGVLLNKPGIIKLNAGDSFSCIHKIIIEQ